MTSRQIIACANRGAKLLDRIRPTWFKDINIRALDLENPSHCIIGQLNNGIFAPDSFVADAVRDQLEDQATTQLRAAAKKINIPGFKTCEIDFDLYGCLEKAVDAGLKGFDAYTHGFNLDEDDHDTPNQGFSILTEAWVALIKARRSSERRASARRKRTNK